MITEQQYGTKFLECIDHSVSKEEFQLKYFREYDVLKTQPIPTNIDKYYESNAYISHTDSSKNIIEFLYQRVKTVALKNKLKLLNSLNTEDKTILDIGAGTGDFLKICKINNWTVTGIEPNEKARKIAKNKDILLKADINELQQGKFDIITLWHVLEHVENINEYVTKLKRLLKPNGYLIIAVPNYKCYDASHYGTFWAAYDVPRHIWHFSRKAITRLFKEINMEIIKIKGMKFDSYYVSILSEKYKKSLFPICKGIYLGYLSNKKAKKTKEYSSNTFILKIRN